jgi:RNA polymerase sigma-70 factor (ECF subfamily)
MEIAWRAFSRLGVPEGALADAVQDTLLVVYRRQGEFRGESSFRTWVYGIVLRIASNYRRRERRAKTVFATDSAVSAERRASGEPSPFDRLEQKVATELLHALLDELPQQLRDVFVLVELEELSLDNAATALGMRVTTCKSRLRSARRAFEARVARTRARLLQGRPPEDANAIEQAQREEDS